MNRRTFLTYLPVVLLAAKGKGHDKGQGKGHDKEKGKGHSGYFKGHDNQPSPSPTPDSGKRDGDIRPKVGGPAR